MKKSFLTILIWAVISSVGFWSCDKLEDYSNPDMPDGSVNPTFVLVDTEETINIGKEGGVIPLDVMQSTNYKWVVTSDQAWATLDVAETDTLSGDQSLEIVVAEYNAIDLRVATIKLQEVAPKENRTITVRIVQAGAEAEIYLDQTDIATDAMGGMYDVGVTTNGGTWTASSDVPWLSVSPTTGKDDLVTVTVGKNVNPDMPNRTGTITFVSGSATAVISVVQTGYTTCNEPNNESTIYFDEFSPCEDAEYGDTWTLTDRRDGKTYKVQLMADGHYWMIEDLRYGGDVDVVATKNTFSTDHHSQTGVLGQYISGIYGDIVNITSNGTSDINPRPGRGYFYNWRAAIQQADISTGSAYEKTQGIAPSGWHIPSVDEFKALRNAIGIDGIMWGENAASVWKGIFGGDIDGGTRRNWGLGANGYYWTSTNFISAQGASVPMLDHQAVAWRINNVNVDVDNVNVYLEENGPGVAEPVKKNKNGGALIRCIRNY